MNKFHLALAEEQEHLLRLIQGYDEPADNGMALIAQSAIERAGEFITEFGLDEKIGQLGLFDIAVISVQGAKMEQAIQFTRGDLAIQIETFFGDKWGKEISALEAYTWLGQFWGKEAKTIWNNATLSRKIPHELRRRYNTLNAGVWEKLSILPEERIEDAATLAEQEEWTVREADNYVRNGSPESDILPGVGKLPENVVRFFSEYDLEIQQPDRRTVVVVDGYGNQVVVKSQSPIEITTTT